jgi:hypothetical protein
MARRHVLSLRAVFCELRSHLLSARDDKDGHVLRSLGYIFGTIEELAVEKGDGPTARLAIRMYDAVRAIIDGNECDSDFPSIEEIEATLPDDT